MSETAALTLMQWLSPGFPVGAFAYSHGLEHAITDGAIGSAQDLNLWLTDLLSHGGGLADAVLLAAAYRADENDVTLIDATARAFAASSERLLETTQQGGAFARTVDAIWSTDLGPLTYPVAVGRAARSQGIPMEQTGLVYLHAFTANLISAAVRLVPLGQTQGQKLLADLAPLIQQTAEQAMETNPEDIASHCFAADIAAMQHETQYSKVFRT